MSEAEVTETAVESSREPGLEETKKNSFPECFNERAGQAQKTSRQTNRPI